MKDSTALHTCRSCGNQFTGKYCNVCGEKVFDEHSKSLAHIGEEVVHFLTHFEGSFITTLKTVFTQPGKLSLDYCNGIRKKYFKPVPFFLFVVVLYLLFPRFQGLNMRFETYVSKDYNYYPLALPMARKKLASFDGNLQAMAKQYNAKSAKLAKPLIFIMIPVTGLLFYAFFFRRRGYFFDHLMLATEFNSFYIAFNYLLVPLIMLLVGTFYSDASSFFDDEGPAWLIANLLLTVFLAAALHRFYQIKWGASAVWALVLLACFLMLVEYFYKMVLYYCVMFTI